MKEPPWPRSARCSTACRRAPRGRRPHRPAARGTPVLMLPEPFANTWRFALRGDQQLRRARPGVVLEQLPHRRAHRHPLRRAGALGDRKDREDVAQVPPRRLIGPAAVIDVTAEVADDPDFLLEIAHVEAWEAEHGPLPDGGWLLCRTGWDARRAPTARRIPQRGRERPAHPGRVRRVRPLARRAGAGARGRRRDRGHGRRRRALLRSAVPLPRVHARRRQVRPDPAAQPRQAPAAGAVLVASPLPILAAPAARPACWPWSSTR